MLQWGRDQLIAELKPRCEQTETGLWLQWGRDQLIAELRCREIIEAQPDRLQWGRDQLIAELHAQLAGFREQPRFNGAAIN